MTIKYLYLDLETGGLDAEKYPITQVGFILEIDGQIVEKFNETIEIPESIKLDPEATIITGYVREAPGQLPDKVVYKKLIGILERYVDVYNPKDKLYLVTYNGHAFDTRFLRKWFLDNGNKWYGSYFWFPSVDLLLLASAFAIGQRHKLGNFKLATVAKSLGIEVDKDKLHDAFYDVELTRAIFKVLEPEILNTQP